MSTGRHPFKQTPRDQRAHSLIEWYLAEHGTGYEHTIQLKSHDAANEGRLSLRRGGRHYGVSVAAWVSRDGERCAGDCPAPQDPHALVFSLHSKDEGRAHVARAAGGNADNLRWNPYARRQK